MGFAHISIALTVVRHAYKSFIEIYKLGKVYEKD